MISVFRNASVVSRANVVFPRMDYIKQRMRLNLQMVLSHYKFRRMVVRSNHILVRLLQSVTIPHSIETYRYMDLVKQAAYSTGRSMGIGSAIYPCTIFKDGHFFGADVNEIIFLEELSDPDLTALTTPWHQVEPIKIWQHPRTDLSFQPLVPSTTTAEKGLAVIQIDPALLFYMFRGWKKEQLSLPEEQRLTVNHFVAMYVLPSMLKSYLDVAFANRVYAKLFDLPVNPTRTLSGLALSTMDTYLTQVVDQMTKVITERNYRYDTILKAIPLPFNQHLESIVILPDMPATRYAKGIEFACTAKWLQMLRKAELGSVGNANTQFQSETRIVIRRARNERWMSNFQGDAKHLIAIGDWLTQYDPKSYTSLETYPVLGEYLEYVDDTDVIERT